MIQRLIYRADQPYRREYSAIRYPAELNRRPGWLAAVGPYVCHRRRRVSSSSFSVAGGRRWCCNGGPVVNLIARISVRRRG